MSRLSARLGVAVLATASCLAALTPAAQAASDANPHTPTWVQGTRVWPQDIAPIATLNGVTVVGSGYGSSFTAKPGSSTTFYGITDRGPNVDGPDGSKILPVPGFQPAIGEFKLVNGEAKLIRTIKLTGPHGERLNGYRNDRADTGETMENLAGETLPTSPWGYDPEGLAVMRDGSFWVSDEYGPFITHFDKHGRELQRFSPFGGWLPAELAEREPNKGMEGLTVTPDGRTLVGIMQAALNAPDNTDVKSKKISAVRIVTIDIATRRTHEYIYALHNTKGADTTVSEISALSATEFLVDERDSTMEPGANKKLFKITLDGTDVGPRAIIPGTTFDGAKGGLLIEGQSIEKIAGKGSTAETTAALKAAGITPVSSSLFLDVAGLVTAIDPKGGYFGHDKVEGVAVVDGGRRLVISNDSDFGLDGVTNTAAPWQVKAKLLPNGQQDTGELLEVDMVQVPAQFKG